MKCKYEKLNGHCHREALDNSNRGYCLLHEDWNHKNEEETKEEFYREIEEGETDFEGCILPEVNLSGREIDGIGLSSLKNTSTYFTLHICKEIYEVGGEKKYWRVGEIYRLSVNLFVPFLLFCETKI